MNCIRCLSDQTVKDGHNPSGSEKYYCHSCHRNFTPRPTPKGYSQEKRQEAVKMYVDGTNYRRVGRFMKVSHQSVVNWVTQAADHIKPEDAAIPEVGEDAVVELDELFTFISSKKKKPTLLRKSTGKPAVL